MSKKITYLLGAGASANAIPVVADMHERIKEVAEYLDNVYKRYCSYIKDILNSGSYPHPSAYNPRLLERLEDLKHISHDLNWLIKQAGMYYTIDTLARKYYLTSDNESLARLKHCLILYFSIEQTIKIPTKKEKPHNFIKEPIDKRYGSLIAAVTNKRYPIPGRNQNALTAENLPFEINRNIKILSWNYDMQFELSIQSLLMGTIIDHIKCEFQILPHWKSMKAVNDFKFDMNKFAMVKLNGDAVWYKSVRDTDRNIHSIFDGNSKEGEIEALLAEFLESYASSDIGSVKLSPAATPFKSLNFAWENDENFVYKHNGHTRNLEIAEMIAAETEVLVVIGYSFPIFNRAIDSKLFNKMNNLERIYIQDKNPDRIESLIRNAFSILQDQNHGAKNPVAILKESYTDQFVIPFELNQ